MILTVYPFSIFQLLVNLSNKYFIYIRIYRRCHIFRANFHSSLGFPSSCPLETAREFNLLFGVLGPSWSMYWLCHFACKHLRSYNINLSCLPKLNHRLKVLRARLLSPVLFNINIKWKGKDYKNSYAISLNQIFNEIFIKPLFW